MTATAVPITAQQLFSILADDPRVKAYPRLVEALRDAVAVKEAELDAFRRNLGRDPLVKEAWLDAARALLKELGEIE